MTTIQQPFHSHQKWVIATVIFGALLPLIDTTAINLAVPAMQQGLHSDVTSIKWVIIGYSLFAVMTVALCAWLTRKVGATQLWLAGLLLFTVSSALCANAASLDIILVARALQGVGAGILMVGMQTLLVKAVGREQLKQAMTIVAMPAVIAPMLGPVLAGYLLSVGDWSWLFWINVPIGGVALVLSFFVLPREHADEETRLDVLGVLLVSVGVGSILYLAVCLDDVSSTGHAQQWSMPVLATMCSFFVWGWVKRHFAALGDNALIRLAPLSIPSCRASLVLLFLASLAFYGGLLAIPLVCHESWQLTSMQTGFMLGMHGVGTLMSRRYLAKWCARYPVSRIAAIALFIGVTASLALVFVGSSLIALAMTMLMRGAGLGLLTLLAMSHTFNDTPQFMAPDASVLSRLGTLAGATIGPMIIMVVYQWTPDDYQAAWTLSMLVVMLLGAIGPILQLAQTEDATC
ncbi:MFS transporter [Salinivibrio sp. IB872]|uniref:MFS transporter n=1 Tax=Salinivibrio sp. IB872 TaxID=1766123 RepID=UPI000986E1D6|nr:MFS transporter [Salinivibrio sp. IB872]OOF22853.1 hypothetical protein BZJ18_14730 [Salinivibrio sp. IB872]